MAINSLTRFASGQRLLNGEKFNRIFGMATGGTIGTPVDQVAGMNIVNLTVASASGSNVAVASTYRCTTAQTANANIVPATVTGMAAPVAVGTYAVRIVLYTTVASGTAGIAITGLLTTAVLGVGNFVTTAQLAASVATTAATSVTSPISFYTAATQPVQIVVDGTFTVTTAGTLTIQMCQNTSNASNSVVNVGSYMTLTKIA
jgi:hypothetical protein